MLTHDAIVRAKCERLCVGDQYVDPFEDIEVGLAFLGIDYDGIVLMPDFLDDVEGWHSIGFDGLSAGHTLFKYGLDVLSIDVFQSLHSSESDRFIPCFRHDEERDFAGSAASFVPALLDSPAEEGVIDLNEAGEQVFGVSGLHGLANFVQHDPAALEIDVDLAGQSQRREATLVSRDQVDGPEPFHERRPGAVYDRTRCERSRNLQSTQ